jgi:hypothetical protein
MARRSDAQGAERLVDALHGPCRRRVSVVLRTSRGPSQMDRNIAYAKGAVVRGGLVLMISAGRITGREGGSSATPFGVARRVVGGGLHLHVPFQSPKQPFTSGRDHLADDLARLVDLREPEGWVRPRLSTRLGGPHRRCYLLRRPVHLFLGIEMDRPVVTSLSLSWKGKRLELSAGASPVRIERRRKVPSTTPHENPKVVNLPREVGRPHALGQERRSV